MKTQLRPIISGVDGETRQAAFATCSDCGCIQFLVFDLNGHTHLQCVVCDQSYCQGGDCANDPGLLRPEPPPPYDPAADCRLPTADCPPCGSS